MDTFQDEVETNPRLRSTVVGVKQDGGRRMEPFEMVSDDHDDKNHTNENDNDDDDNHMDSFLESGQVRNGKSSRQGGGNGSLDAQEFGISTQSYMNGMIQAKKIGNMQILFPQYFETSGWGVVGPQWFGPASVWLILVVASHLCIHKATSLGLGSVILCYMFFGVSTYLLTDVSFRDPGICLYKEIPETVSPSERNQWRWCDFCQGYQPPSGAHCPDCNVCIAGYDHHCVWMGTCIGKRNYRQFVRFNVSWLYFLGYVILWLVTFGPLVLGD